MASAHYPDRGTVNAERATPSSGLAGGPASPDSPAGAARRAAAPPARRWTSLFIPREHGSWGMLLTVLILAPTVLGTRGAAWWFAAGAVVLLFARRPWEIWIHAAPHPDPVVRRSALLLTALGLALGGGGLRAAPSPLTAALALAAASLAGFSVYAESRPERRSAVAGRLAGAAAMVALFLLQAAATFGHVPPAGWALAALCLAYFVTSGLRVRSLVRARKVRGFRVVSLMLHGAVLAGAAVAALVGAVPPGAPLAFVPGVVQAARIVKRDATPVNTRRMGIGEIVHAAGFVALTIIAWRLTGL